MLIDAGVCGQCRGIRIRRIGREMGGGTQFPLLAIPTREVTITLKTMMHSGQVQRNNR